MKTKPSKAVIYAVIYLVSSILLLNITYYVYYPEIVSESRPSTIDILRTELEILVLLHPYTLTYIGSKAIFCYIGLYLFVGFFSNKRSAVTIVFLTVLGTLIDFLWHYFLFVGENSLFNVSYYLANFGLPYLLVIMYFFFSFSMRQTD